MPSPVKVSIDTQKREEDSIIKAIRYISNLVNEYFNRIILSVEAVTFVMFESLNHNETTSFRKIEGNYSLLKRRCFGR